MLFLSNKTLLVLAAISVIIGSVVFLNNRPSDTVDPKQELVGKYEHKILVNEKPVSPISRVPNSIGPIEEEAPLTQDKKLHEKGTFNESSKAFIGQEERQYDESKKDFVEPYDSNETFDNYSSSSPETTPAKEETTPNPESKSYGGNFYGETGKESKKQETKESNPSPVNPPAQQSSNSKRPMIFGRIPALQGVEQKVNVTIILWQINVT